MTYNSSLTDHFTTKSTTPPKAGQADTKEDTHGRDPSEDL